MMTNSKFSFYRELTKRIQEIAKNYFIALRKTQIKGLTLSDSESEENDYERHVRRVKNAFDSLDALEKTFINNEFFYEDYPDWWNKTFSKTTYYRLRRRSMIRFVEAFESE